MVPKRIGRCYELAGKVMTGGRPARIGSRSNVLCAPRTVPWLRRVLRRGHRVRRSGDLPRCRTATRKSACVPSRPRCSFMRSIARSTGGAGVIGGVGAAGRSRCMVDFARHRSRRDSPPNGLPRRCARSSASSIDDVAFRSPNKPCRGGYEASAGFGPSGDLLVARCHCNLVARCHCNSKFRVGPRN